MRLKEVAQELVGQIEFLSGTAQHLKSAARLGKLCHDISRFHRAFGICILLVEGDPDAFFHGLIQSAVIRRYYLRRCKLEQLPFERDARASMVGPFLDAVAANQWKLAREIAALSPSIWMQGHEYEDDFAWALFLHRAGAEAPSEPAMKGALDQLERALEGALSARLELGRALLAKDQDAFEAAFDGLLAEYERTMGELAEPKRNSLLADDYTFEPSRFVFVEGLALLRLAEARGLRTRAEYPLCPGPARAASYAPFSPYAWPYLGLEP